MATPTSAVISASSSSSQVSASTFERDRSEVMNFGQLAPGAPQSLLELGRGRRGGLPRRGQGLVIGRAHPVGGRSSLSQPDDEGDRRQADGQHDDQDQDQDLHRGGGYRAQRS